MTCRHTQQVLDTEEQGVLTFADLCRELKKLVRPLHILCSKIVPQLSHFINVSHKIH